MCGNIIRLVDGTRFDSFARSPHCSTIALAVLRNRNGKRNPPYFQRSDAEDLVAILFPDQIACGENIAGDRQIPDHPLIKQTINDCLHETMDIVGLEALLTLSYSPSWKKAFALLPVLGLKLGLEKLQLTERASFSNLLLGKG